MSATVADPAYRRALPHTYMDSAQFKAMVVEQAAGGGFARAIRPVSVSALPPGDVLVRVRYSSLNYKDALSATGHRGVTRRYPHTPGIDAAGEVEESAVPEFRRGDEVIVTGYDLGMNTAGGYGQRIRVPAGWLVPRPAGLTLRESMIYGTAGFTAALSLHRLQVQGITPDMGEVLVTGATGGVGSIAVGLLARSGYHVVAATGKVEEGAFLAMLGAKEIMRRDTLTDPSGRALLPGRWAGVVDTVGGGILAAAIKSTREHGVVTCCGLVAAAELHTSVYPFILRGVALLGIDSVNTPMPLRRTLWQKLAGAWKLPMLDRLAIERTLDSLDPEIGRILEGKQKGRVLVNLGD